MVENAAMGVTMVIPAGTAMDQNGQPYTGEISIVEVPVDFAPVALPSDMQPAMLVSIQPAGEITFTQPIPITFPNADGMTPGNEMELFSVNPSTGQFEMVGTGQIDASGTVVETTSGGIQNSSWHFPMPPGVSAPPPGGPSGPGSAGGPPVPGNKNDPDNCQNCPPKSCNDPACPNDGGGGGANPGTGSGATASSGSNTVSGQSPSVQSFGGSHGSSFSYSSSLAGATAVFTTQATVPQRSAVPNSTSIKVSVAGIEQPGESFTQTGGTLSESLDETILKSIQIDGQNLPTGSYPLRADLTNHWNLSKRTSSVFTNLLHRNEIDSPYGSGWTLDGVQRLLLQADGSAVIAEGDGGTKRFALVEPLPFFPDFADLSNIQLNGKAANYNSTPYVVDGSIVLRLTSASNFDVSSIYWNTPIALTSNSTPVSFTSQFSFKIPQLSVCDGNGLAFVIAPSANSIGPGGSNLAYTGIEPSIAVALTTWLGSRVAIRSNGSLSELANAVPAESFLNREIHHVWVDYDGPTTTIEVRTSTSTVRPEQPLLTHQIDIAALMGQSTPFFGFTSANGGPCLSEHDLFTWSLTKDGASGIDDFNSPPATTPRSPATLTTPSPAASKTASSSSSTLRVARPPSLTATATPPAMPMMPRTGSPR